MSWADKRISLPSFFQGGSSSNTHENESGETGSSWILRSNNNTVDTVRDIKTNLVRTASLRKLKKNKLKWFVLYGDTPGDPSNPAHLEYHDDDKKWKAGFPPKRSIILNKCLNICRKQDSRDSKNKKVIALYTLEDSVSILFEQEEELRIWLDLLLSHQQGRNANGKIPKPNYEHMWQVKVRNFQPESKNSQFTMSGLHRVCVTSDDVKFFPVGSGEPIVFPVDCIRNCGTINRHFRLEAGRSSVSGPGLLIIECEDREIANNINVRVLASMRESETVRHGTTSRSVSQYNPQRHITGSGRPRSESWSNHDKPALPSSAPSASSKLHLSSGSSFMKDVLGSSKSSLSSNMRYRTTSEGGHFDVHKSRRPLISSSPNSPGSFMCSSESAGSSNSIEDPGVDAEGKHCFPSMTPDSSHVADTTIYEESSGESAADIDRTKDSFTKDLLDKNGTSYISIGSKAPEGLTESSDYIDMSSISVPTSSVGKFSLGPSLDLTSPTSSSVTSLGGSTTVNTSSYSNEGDYHLMSPSQSHLNDDDEHSGVTSSSPRMSIPLPSSVYFSNSYVTMSPVSVDIEKLTSIEEENVPTSRLALEERLGTPVKIRGDSRGQYNYHRNSYCSSTEDGSRWSPGPPTLPMDSYNSSPHLPIDPDFPIDPDSNYVPLDFATIDRSTTHHHDVRRRVSPASSCSIISAGTPSSVEFHQPNKAVSHIIRDDDDDIDDVLSNNNGNQLFYRNSNRTYSVGSRPSSDNNKNPTLPPLPAKSGSRNGSRFIDIPTKSSSSSNPSAAATHWLKQSPGGTSSSGQSPSSNIMSNFNSWFRHRAGSVPSRPPFFERKRHRTQSEGEKEEQ